MSSINATLSRELRALATELKQGGAAASRAPRIERLCSEAPQGAAARAATPLVFPDGVLDDLAAVVGSRVLAPHGSAKAAAVQALGAVVPVSHEAGQQVLRHGSLLRALTDDVFVASALHETPDAGGEVAYIQAFMGATVLVKSLVVGWPSGARAVLAASSSPGGVVDAFVHAVKLFMLASRVGPDTLREQGMSAAATKKYAAAARQGAAAAACALEVISKSDPAAAQRLAGNEESLGVLLIALDVHAWAPDAPPTGPAGELCSHVVSILSSFFCDTSLLQSLEAMASRGTTLRRPARDSTRVFRALMAARPDFPELMAGAIDRYAPFAAPLGRPQPGHGLHAVVAIETCMALQTICMFSGEACDRLLQSQELVGCLLRHCAATCGRGDPAKHALPEQAAGALWQLIVNLSGDGDSEGITDDPGLRRAERVAAVYSQFPDQAVASLAAGASRRGTGGGYYEGPAGDIAAAQLCCMAVGSAAAAADIAKEAAARPTLPAALARPLVGATARAYAHPSSQGTMALRGLAAVCSAAAAAGDAAGVRRLVGAEGVPGALEGGLLGLTGVAPMAGYLAASSAVSITHDAAFHAGDACLRVLLRRAPGLLRKHWKEGGHREECRRLQDQAAAARAGTV
ncbi:hypothetical protein MNEG_2043 [Monoraphidium neglectum]|uniref:Uncharacterized protein n=1 Tax=Monoraphidium neglectum TaxID=145388 RepID=A0A0D2K6D4_9CHLO|nr:hypothetical protein MNEG_2043 [Monoraphidium neglectum]KIZ05908.1 hypothetical protein MNEG_2043 [Monoraphidium neglectum]|eukprot:XP_013904927.1 hypothetical protein MNEG_2043 [Monoraphidium neglectum]